MSKWVTKAQKHDKKGDKWKLISKVSKTIKNDQKLKQAQLKLKNGQNRINKIIQYFGLKLEF